MDLTDNDKLLFGELYFCKQTGSTCRLLGRDGASLIIEVENGDDGYLAFCEAHDLGELCHAST